MDFWIFLENEAHLLTSTLSYIRYSGLALFSKTSRSFFQKANDPLQTVLYLFSVYLHSISIFYKLYAILIQIKMTFIKQTWILQCTHSRKIPWNSPVQDRVETKMQNDRESGSNTLIHLSIQETRISCVLKYSHYARSRE